MLIQFALLMLAIWVIWYYMLPPMKQPARKHTRTVKRITRLLDTERESLDDSNPDW